jgi:hypothetical protein
VNNQCHNQTLSTPNSINSKSATAAQLKTAATPAVEDSKKWMM